VTKEATDVGIKLSLEKLINFPVSVM